jgi:[acyl-carrier-protein] S-malonyltransferase
METLVALGAGSFLEVGPGGVLAGLARRAVPGNAVHVIAVPEDVPPLMEVA